MSRVMLTHAAGAPGGGWVRAQGRAASGFEAEAAVEAAAGVTGFTVAALAVAGVAGELLAAARFDQVWSMFLCASWTKSRVR